mgnify:CR=1 FL=1
MRMKLLLHGHWKVDGKSDIKKEFVVKQNIIKFGKLLYDKDLTSATSGNISVRLGNKIYITATGTALGFLTEKDIVEIDTNGKEFSSYQKASSEKFMHIAIYNLRKDINAIIHCHSPFSTAIFQPFLPFQT